MEEKEMSARLRKIIGEDLHSLTGEELAIFLDYEIERCEKDEKGTFMADRCTDANMLTAEALRRLGEDYKSFLNKRGYEEIKPNDWYNKRLGIGFHNNK